MEVLRQPEDIAVIGGGGHARVVISILRKISSYRVRGYTDLKDCGELLGAQYLGTDRELSGFAAGSGRRNAVVAVGQTGSGKVREGIWQRLGDLQLTYPVIVSPDAIVNEGVALSLGVTVMDGVIINTGTRLGVGVIANTHSTIEHDVVLGDWVHIAPGATISGGVTVGSFSMIGAGATIIEGVSVAPDTIIGAGATVIDTIAEAGVYVGTPARRIK